MIDVERLIEACERHGTESEPDHEVGDLQGLLRAAVGCMQEGQVTRFMQTPAVKDLLDEWDEDLFAVHATILRDDHGESLPAVVRFEDGGVLIQVAGHGNVGGDGEFSAPIVYLELWRGEPRLVVFADYNRKVSTHTINLVGAKMPTNNRTEDDCGS